MVKARLPFILLSFGLAAGMVAALGLLVSPAWAASGLWAPTIAPTCFSEYTGDNTADFSSNDASAVRNALAAAPVGGLVKLAGTCPGTILENTTFQVALITKTLTVQGGYSEADWQHSYPLTQVTTLDAQHGGRVLLALTATTLIGLRLVNGVAPIARGGALASSHDITLTQVIVESSAVTGASGPREGGGAYLSGLAIISGSTFLSNTAFANGGGLYVGAGGSQIINSTFRGNTTLKGDGGGLLLNPAALEDYYVRGLYFYNNQALLGRGGGGTFIGPGSLADSQVISNYAGGEGGGFYLASITHVSNSTFMSNTSGAGGGGVAQYFGGRLTDVSFIGNRTVGYGGGLAAYTDLTIEGGVFTDNHALTSLLAVEGGNGSLTEAPAGGTNKGGGAYFGGGVTLTETSFQHNTAFNGAGAFFAGPATISDSSFTANGDPSAYGGGADFEDDALVVRTGFYHNRANDGSAATVGGVGVDKVRQFINVVFAGNSASYATAGTLSLAANGGSVAIVHSTFASATVAGGAAISTFYTATIGITDTLIASYTTGLSVLGGGMSADYVLFDHVATPYAGAVSAGPHMLTGTAGFVDLVAGNLHLGPLSDAIDAGVNAGVSDDFDGVSRPLDAGFDIGAYEGAGNRVYLPLLFR